MVQNATSRPARNYQDLCDQLQADFKLFGKFLFPGYLKSFQNDLFRFLIKFSCYLIAPPTLSEKSSVLCQVPLEAHWRWRW